MAKKLENEISNSYPLTPSQQRIRFVEELIPDSPLHNVALRFRLKGKLNIKAFERAINELISRHDALRTSFSTIADTPAQFISKTINIEIPVTDLSKLRKASREKQAENLVAELSLNPFDLTLAPLLKASLIKLGKDDHLLPLVFHKIIFDDRSIEVFLKELSSHYSAFCNAAIPKLSTLNPQYIDFVNGQSQWLESDESERSFNYWRDMLANIEPLELLSDNIRPSFNNNNGTTFRFKIPLKISSKLKSLSRKIEADYFLIFLTVFYTFLYRYTGNEDITVGTNVSIRGNEKLEHSMGNYSNTLALRTDLSALPTFKELIERVKDVYLEADAHKSFPFERLIDEFVTDRDMSRSPLVQMGFNYGHINIDSLTLSGIELSSLPVDNSTSKLDLTLNMWEEGKSFEGEIEYNVDLFEPDTVERMAEHYRILIEGIVENPDRRISELPIMSEAEYAKLVVGFNEHNPNVDYEDKCIHQLFEEQVERTPDNIALVFEDQRLTYKELNERANQLAHYLIKLGVGPEVTVGIMVERSVELIVGILGIMKAGGAYVPFDPSYPKERIEFMLSDSKSELLITHESLTEMVPSNNIDTIVIDRDWSSISDMSKEDPTNTVNPDNLIYIVYTSGSTGVPKGIEMIHSALINLINWQIEDLTESPVDIIIQFSSISFAVSFQEIFTALSSGGTIVLITENERRNPSELLKKLKTANVDKILFPYVALQQLTLAAMSDGAEGLSLSDVVTTGETLQITPQIETFFNATPKCFLYNQYGLSETHVVSSFKLAGEPEEWPAHPPIGRPITNCQIYILDENFEHVPIGATGEIFIGGVCLARGYLNRPEITAEKFVPNPFSEIEGDRLYRTGDLARYRDDGVIEFIGRRDKQVKIRGYRVELGEIAHVILEHPDCNDCVVATKEDKFGQNKIIAYLIPQSSTVDITQVREFLKIKLPNYMLPSAFIVLDSFPLTPSGKIDRKALLAIKTVDREHFDNYFEPKHALDRQLVSFWEELLEVRPIGIRDNFFDLGGNSLIAVSLLTKISKNMNFDLPIVELFQNPTIEHIRNVIGRSENTKSSILIELQPGGDNLPFFCVHPIGGTTFRYLKLAKLLGDNQPFYALESPGIEEEEQQHTKVEEMAEIYIREITNIQAKGPFMLGGYSFGGLVAYEMAQQLLAKGEDVSLLALIEPVDLSGAGQDNGDTFGDILGISKPELEQFLDDLGLSKERVTKLYELFGKFSRENQLNAMPMFNLEEYATGPDLKLVRNILRTLQNNMIATVKYKLKPYPSKLSLFNTGVKVARNLKDTSLGWKNLAQGRTSVYIIPGDHFNLLDPPQVEILAARLKSCLDRAQVKK